MPRRLALLLLALAAALPIRASDTPLAPPAPSASTSSQLLSATLPNGLRYAVLPRSTEPGRISLRLIVHAGSLDEHDDERGLAHFVEHMAFNGTRHYPPGKLVPFFQRLGLAWGADANAETSFTSTIYRIDLPAAHAAHLAEALQVLADFAGGIEFAPAEVRRERGVILSELRARDDDDWQRRLQRIAITYAGTGLPERLPVGDSAVIDRAEAPALRRFYERCYRPERMTLLVVGDVAPASLEKLLLASFSSLRRAESPVPPARPALAAVQPFSVAIITTPLSKAAKATLVSSAALLDDTPASVRAILADATLISMLNRRLDARRAGDPHIGDATAFVEGGIDNRYVHFSLEAHASHLEWTRAVAFVENELRRARTSGFNAAEIKETTAAVLAGLRANAASFPGLPVDRVAGEIASVLAAGRTWRSPDELLASAENLFAAFSPADAAERLRATFADDRLRLILTTHTAPEGGAEAILAAWRASAAEPLAAASSAATDLVCRYDDFGPPGAIAARTTAVDLGVESIRFANNVRVNLRASTVEPKRFRLWARLGRGTPDVPRDQPGLHYFAAALLARCDLGRHTREELRRLFDAHALEGGWNVENNHIIIQLSGPSDQLPLALKFLTAQLVDAKLEASRLADAVSIYPSLIGQLVNSGDGLTRVETLFRASSDDPRFHLANQAEVQRFPFETVAAWMRAHWFEGPLEVGLAGDFALDDTVPAIAATLGTISPRHETPAVPADRLVLRTQFYRNLNIVPLPDHVATVRLLWPAPEVAAPRTERALQLAAAALQDHVRLTLREQLGVTYSPSGAVYHDALQPDFAFVALTLTFPPDQAIPLAEKSLTLTAKFAKKGLSREEFSRLREPLRAAALAELRTNEWWLANVLVFAQTRPAVLEEARLHASAFDTITREEVNRLLASRVSLNTGSCVGVIPQASPAPGPAPAKR